MAEKEAEMSYIMEEKNGVMEELFQLKKELNIACQTVFEKVSFFLLNFFFMSSMELNSCNFLHDFYILTQVEFNRLTKIRGKTLKH